MPPRSLPLDGEAGVPKAVLETSLEADLLVDRGRAFWGALVTLVVRVYVVLLGSHALEVLSVLSIR